MAICNLFHKRITGDLAETPLPKKEIAVVKHLDVGAAKEGLNNAARAVGTFVNEQAEGAKIKVQEVTTKGPDRYDEAVSEYNGAYTAMSDKGLELFMIRQRTTDLVEFVEQLVNSIANTPKSFAADFGQISIQKEQFLQSEEFARRDLDAARKSAAGAGAGFTASAAVASMAPTAALWIATTFGTASTGTAISTLSGAAATNAALAWLGGGTLAAGGGGTAAGGALLALAGPIGWTIAGATLLTSIFLFTKKKFETREAKQEALTAVKVNTARVKELEALIEALLTKAVALREQLVVQYSAAILFFGSDFTNLDKDQQALLGTLVNNTLASTAQLGARVNDSDGE